MHLPGLPWPSRPILVAFGSAPAAPPAAPLVDAQTRRQRRRGARHSATRHTAPWEMPWDAQRQGVVEATGDLLQWEVPKSSKVTMGFKVSILKWSNDSNDLDDFGVPNHEKKHRKWIQMMVLTKQNGEF